MTHLARVSHHLRRSLHPAWLALILMVACGPQPTPSGSQATTPAGLSPPPPITATLPDGSVIHLELALTPDEISRGLMFRPSLAADRGMLFLFTETRHPTFWMKDTRIPLDIVFLDESGTVVNVEHDAPPCAAEPCPRYTSRLPSRAVLELAAGVAARRALVEGSQIRFAGVPGYPPGG